MGSTSSRGKANQGKAWERQIAQWNYGYEARKVAAIEQSQERWSQVRGSKAGAGGVVRAKRIGRGPVDFCGHVFDGGPFGIPVAFDAKSTRQHRWRLDTVAEHQARRLDLWESTGGIAFIALEMTCGIRVLRVVIDWRALGPLRAAAVAGNARRGWSSLTVETAAGIGAPVGGAGWLAPVLAIARDRRSGGE